MLKSIIIISIVGTISHFIYDISNHNKIIGLFTSVNESTWEHIKIALTPTILYSLYDGYLYGNNPNYFFAKFVSISSIIIIIPLIFYSYQKIIKKRIVLIDISSFYIAIIISQILFYRLLDLKRISFLTQYLSCVFLFILFGCYLLFTIFPPNSFLFKDPRNNNYGYNAH